MMTRVVLELVTTDERAIVRLLRALLKTLGRIYHVRCRAVHVEPAPSADG